MQLGLHLIVRKDLGRLAEQGAEVSAPYLGVVDLVRAVEGNLPEPPPSMPLGLVGLDALCLASGSGAHEALAVIRRGVHDGKRYFDWKQIPLVFLVEGELDHDPRGGAMLRSDGERFSLHPLLGRGIKPLHRDQLNWWWTPQLG